MASINDVAKLARVSISTVSLAVNYPERVSEETRQRIFRAMKELRYTPSPKSGLRGPAKKNSVALITSEVSGPYFYEIMRGISETLTLNNLEMILLSGTDAEKRHFHEMADNPLVIPEGRPDKWFMAHAFYAFAEHEALCFSPFGIEDVGMIRAPGPDAVIQCVFQTFEGRDTSLQIRETYGVLDSLSSLICQSRGTGRLHGILQGRLINQTVELSGYYAHISFTNFIDRMEIPGGGMILELGENDFLLAGAGYSARFVPKPDTPPYFEYLSIEEGRFIDGQWVRRRRLNGDERHPVLPPSVPALLRVRLFGYQ